MKLLFESLLPKFEYYLVRGDKKLRFGDYFKSVINFLFFEYRISALDIKDDTSIIFWPIQLHHTNFHSIVYEELESQKIKSQAIVFREDLISKLEQYDIDGILVKPKKRLKKIRKIFFDAFQLSKLVFFVLLSNQANSCKMALLKCLTSLSSIKIAINAATSVMTKSEAKYHIVGYDLSAVGRALISVANELGHQTGRIQNGAVNYRLAGFSEVKDLYVWDEESKSAYLSQGFSGNIFVTGNILLQKRYPYENAFPLMNNLLISEFEVSALIALSGPGYNTSVEGHKMTISYIMKLIEKFPSILFVIKLHPKDREHYYKKLKVKHNVKMASELFPKDVPNAINFIHATNFVISGASSVALDALNLGKKVLSVDPLSELEQFQFLNHPNVKRFKREEQLPDVINWIKSGVTEINTEILQKGGGIKIIDNIKKYIH